jgi:halocyanin-like protein
MQTEKFTATRRGILCGGAALGAGLLVGPLSGRASAQTGHVDLTEWLAKTDDASTETDWRGMGAVTIEVGSQGNNGGFAFGPAVARVDPGTTVTWTWTGDGGSHNVVDIDGAFASEFYGEAGATFEWTASEVGVYRYECEPHSPMGMRGVLVVGDAQVTLPSGTPASGGAGGGAENGDGADEPTEEPALGPMLDFDGWLDGTDNYRGVADKRGQSEVTIQVGATGNGGDFAFEPAAVHVDPGTTVVWEWVSDAAAYDVVDQTLDYASETATLPGTTFAMQFDGDGESRYDCSAYGDQGMRGVVVVGAGAEQRLTTQGNVAAVGAVGAVVAPLALGVRYHFENVSDWREGDE